MYNLIIILIVSLLSFSSLAQQKEKLLPPIQESNQDRKEIFIYKFLRGSIKIDNILINELPTLHYANEILHERTYVDETPDDTKYVQDTIDQYRSKMYGIYNIFLKDNPKLDGDVCFRLDISSKGKVKKTYMIHSEIKNTEFIIKLENIFKNIHFESGISRDNSFQRCIDFVAP